MYKKKWYLQTWFISILFTFWFLVVPGIIAIILLFLSLKEAKLIKQHQDNLLLQIEDLKNESLICKKEDLEKINNEIINSKESLNSIKLELSNLIEELNKNRSENIKLSSEIQQLFVQKTSLSEEVNKLNLELTEKLSLIDKNDKAFKLSKELLDKKESLESELKEKQNALIVLDDELLLQSFGFYDPKFNLQNSQEYKDRLEIIRNKQKDMVKSFVATNHLDNWTLDGSLQKGKVMNDSNIKLTLRSFNNECDSIISKVKFNNIDSYEKRIRTAYSTLNKANKNNKIEIKSEYLSLKLDELYLAYEYELKLQEEKEEQQRLREQMREEQKILKEIEAAKQKIEKEERHFSQEIQSLQSKLESAQDSEREKYLEKIKELEDKLKLIEKDKEDVYNREQNTRAGYVYIISNIGSFGENVYKIGMTRRLEPLDRVKELGDASVPFNFDIHAMIFSENAPSLENELHKHFDHRRLNRINLKREFFKVQLSEIELVVKTHHNKTVEFTKLALAEEYRQSLLLEKEMERKLA